MLNSGTFRIGGDIEVQRLGFGAMRLPTSPLAAQQTAKAVARRAVELGVTLIDTAHMYGWGANEELLAKALYPYPDDLLIATKVGIAAPTEDHEWTVRGDPTFLREQVDAGLRRLRVDRLDLVQLHRIDPDTPLADQLGALRELHDAGKIGHIGLSEITVTELTEARQIINVASVQNRYNIVDREHEPVLDACTDAGIAFLPWRPVNSAAIDASPEFAAIADELDATKTQVALAWLLVRSPVILPIPGTTSITHLQENLEAADVVLDDDQRQRLDQIATH